jgi:hypothetical protein
MTNRYESPKTSQKPASLKQDSFMRIQKYQYWGFYGGLIITVGSVILGSSTIWDSVLDATGTIGVLMLFVSIGSILPLSIWGFVKGYRESRRK